MLEIAAYATRREEFQGSIDTIVVDLPFGQLIGSDVDIAALDRGVLAEATRLILPGGHLIVNTTRKKIFDLVLEPDCQHWRIKRMLDLRVPDQSGYSQPVAYALATTEQSSQLSLPNRDR
jgi:23S rRNA G2445 N2-methylase RlmL